MKKTLIAGFTAATLVLSAGAVQAQMAPFGNADDIEYAQAVWEVMVAEKLAGDNSIRTIP